MFGAGVPGGICGVGSPAGPATPAGEPAGATYLGSTVGVPVVLAGCALTAYLFTVVVVLVLTGAGAAVVVDATGTGFGATVATGAAVVVVGVLVGVTVAGVLTTG